MFIVSLVFIFLIVIVWLLVDSLYLAKPPKPAVIWKNKEIPTIIGSNCWKGSLRGTCVDYVYDSDYDMGLRKGSIKVEPNSTITIAFNKKPQPGSLKVAEVFEDGEEEFLEMEENMLKAPAKNGIYVFMIYAKWDQGNPNYAFSITVE